MSTSSQPSSHGEEQGWHPQGAGAGQDVALQDPGCHPHCASLQGGEEEEEEKEQVSEQSHAQRKLKKFGLRIKGFFLTM